MNPQMNEQQKQLNLEIFNNLTGVTIYDCFDYSNRIQTLKEDDYIPCEYCKSNSSTLYQSVLYTPPSVLILIIEQNKNSKIKLQFSENLDLSNYIVHAKSIGYMFKLIGVVSQNEKNEHFMAYCRNRQNEKWFKYNENTISEVKDFKEEIVNSGKVSVLFYEMSN